MSHFCTYVGTITRRRLVPCKLPGSFGLSTFISSTTLKKYSQTLIFAGARVCASPDRVLPAHSLLTKTQVSEVLLHLYENGIAKVFPRFAILGCFCRFSFGACPLPAHASLPAPINSTAATFASPMRPMLDHTAYLLFFQP